MEIISNDDVVARKTHKCNWCHEGINIGERYRRQTCVDGGWIYRVKFHPECMLALSSEANEWGDGEIDLMERRNRGKTWEETYP